MIRLLAILFLLIFMTGHSSQQPVSISRGFFTGKDFFEMSDTEKRAYATGAINGMLVAPLFGAPEDRVDWLKSCSANLSDEQLSSILTRYINNDARQSTMSLNVVTFNAMKDACEKLKRE